MGKATTISWRHSVFWKVAGILIGVQVAIGSGAVWVSGRLAVDRSLELVERSLRLRLDQVAEEVEQREPLRDGLESMSPLLRLDLSNRFPDPVYLLNVEGRAVGRVMPDVDEGDLKVPEQVVEALMAEQVRVQLEQPLNEASWGVTPVYDADGLPVGGILVLPMTSSVNEELAGARQGFQRALWLVVAVAGVLALLIGFFLTWRLVRPLQRITRRVEAIRAGDYAGRIEFESDDELGRLGNSINQMAEAVEHSMHTLRQTDQLRRELIANVGHDLRTPLTALMGYTEEAERYLTEGRTEEAVAALETARRQGRYLHQLVQDLFELSILDSGPPQLRREPIPLAELLNEAARGHQNAFEQAGIRLITELEPGLPVIDGDGVRLLRLVNNLLGNARRHTSSGGQVYLRANTLDAGICVEVEDNGEGMSEELQNHVFERYYRGTGARTRTERGTGLGLAISRAIARAHGGDLTVESSPGTGSRFTLQLPL